MENSDMNTLAAELRDKFLDIADIFQLFIERLDPDEETRFNSLNWEDGVGPKGPYQKCRASTSETFHKLADLLKANDGRVSLTTHDYWMGNKGYSPIVFRRRKR